MSNEEKCFEVDDIKMAEGGFLSNLFIDTGMLIGLVLRIYFNGQKFGMPTAVYRMIVSVPQLFVRVQYGKGAVTPIQVREMTTDGKVGVYDSMDEMPDWLIRKLTVLKLLKVNDYEESIGLRADDHIFYVNTEGEEL